GSAGESFKDEDILPNCDVSGLVNMLNLSTKNKVKKFIIVSSAEIYGNTGDKQADEQTKPNPVTIKGMSSYVMEYYCFRWSELHDLSILSLRASDIYGPPAKELDNCFSEDLISIISEKALNEKDVHLEGKESDTRDFIYIDDFVEGLYRASVNKNCTGVFNLSSKTETQMGAVIKELSSLKPSIKAVYKHENIASIQRSCIDNSKIAALLEWQPKVSFAEGIKLTFNYLKLKSENAKLFIKKNKAKTTGKQPRVVAYIENLVLFLIAAFIQWGNVFFNLKLPDLKIDYSIIYIIIMGIVWGQTQAYIAMILSAALYVGMNIYTGSDIITFLYTPENLIRIAVYVLVGIITGYSIERKNRELEMRNITIQNLTNKYGFLSDIYNETRIVKNELENQIIETEDSFSAIYKIIQEVDSLEIEKVFSGAISAIERIMRTNQVSIYTLNNDASNNFMRLKARSRLLQDKVPNSIKISGFEELKEVINTKSIFVNRSFKPDIPVMMAPVLDEKSVICIISIHNTAFENLTLHYENLFQTVLGLIANALKRAYYFEASLKDKRYIPKTRILTSYTFEKILKEIRNNKAELGMSYTLLKVEKNNLALEQLSERIVQTIRDNDYIGAGSQDVVYILLSNTKNNYANIVVDRLKKVKVDASLIIEDIENE
ncbi:MAG: GDP-mannose 4,6-dehydratase, partial [Actinobacteria bacterium]|nr:GDP-mannose 4,6-dehydratase [Actinomycetota bacterium]